ncbi:PDC sensor domain-containing protein [Bacteroidota bacterium]
MKRLVLIFVVIFSIFNSCKNQQEEDLNLRHLNHIAESINSDLSLIKKEIINLARSSQYKIPFDKEINGFSTEKYHYQSDQILYCTYNSSQSAVYYPSNRNFSIPLKKIIVNSESLDSFFVNSVRKKPLLAQIYFLDTNSFLRIYPYIDVLNYLKSSIDLKLFAPYQTAKEKPFIENRAYWINQPFADPYGRGWIISCVEPIYYRDRFLGILSGDITLYSLKNKYFSSDTEIIIMIDQKGKIICCTKQAAKITNIPIIRAFQYYKPVTENIYAFNKPSLMDHKNKYFRKAIKSLISGKNKEIFFIENNKYTIYKSHIRETDWLLLKIIN